MIDDHAPENVVVDLFSDGVRVKLIVNWQGRSEQRTLTLDDIARDHSAGRVVLRPVPSIDLKTVPPIDLKTSG